MDRKTIKKKLKTIIGKSRLLKSLIITLLAVLVSGLIYCVFGKYLSYIGIDNTNLSYLQEYYKKINSSASSSSSLENYYNADNIFMLDIPDSITRDSIASIIEDVIEYGPKVVGIDVIFKANNDRNDSILVSKIHDYADKIVLAQVVDNDKFKPNLFEEDKFSQNFGIVNSYDFENYNPESDCYKVNGKDYYHFAYEISKRFNPYLNKHFDQFYINYSNTELSNTDVDNFYNDPHDINESRIRDKIVLIGNSESPFDIHPMPFTIQGKMTMSGIYRHAYAINSLISNDVAMKRVSLGSCKNILWYLLMSFVYSLIYVWLTDKKCKFIHEHEIAIKVIRPILLFLFVPILLLSCYWLTKFGRIVPNVVLFLITVFVINTFNDFLEKNINSNKFYE